MRSPAAWLALPVAVAIVAVLVVVAVAPAPANAQVIETGNETTTFGFDVSADGDARVTVTVRLPLSDESDREAFDRLADEHRSSSQSPLSVDPFEESAERASTATGRSMEIQDVTRTSTRTNETGQLSLSFTWTNFAGVSEERLRVGDAFRTPDGTWLPGLAEDQELTISFPPRYSPESISTPGARYQLVNGTVYIQGPATFGPGPPTVVLVQTASPQPPSWDPLTVAVVAIAVLALALLVYVFRNRLRPFGGRSRDEGSSVEEEPTDVDDSDPMSEPLLSDEERVLKLLEARNGRMKQVEIVERTDWSNAKVSQLLSEMDDSGQVEKLRIGRENLISLPGRGVGDEHSGEE